MAFMQENYLLESESALSIYNAVKDLPIIDPHNHADVAEIARNANYENMWQVFAATDHYVWEVMRKRGVEERLITDARHAVGNRHVTIDTLHQRLAVIGQQETVD